MQLQTLVSIKNKSINSSLPAVFLCCCFVPFFYFPKAGLCWPLSAAVRRENRWVLLVWMARRPAAVLLSVRCVKQLQVFKRVQKWIWAVFSDSIAYVCLFQINIFIFPHFILTLMSSMPFQTHSHISTSRLWKKRKCFLECADTLETQELCQKHTWLIELSILLYVSCITYLHILHTEVAFATISFWS